MTASYELLVELLSEEIPAALQRKAAEDFKHLMTSKIADARLTYETASAFATPRRLTLVIKGLLAKSPIVREERRGPRADAPQQAIDGFLRAQGLTIDEVEIRDTPKGRVLFACKELEGRSATEIVGQALTETIRNFPWPKSMRWGSHELRWIRPLHRILCILSDGEATKVVPVNIEGLIAQDCTVGHSSMSPEEFAVSCFDDYQEKLKQAYVILDPDKRAEKISVDAVKLASSANAELINDRTLLAEVAGLVEWPVVMMGTIASEYLSLPAEVMRTTMRTHQKFFSACDPKTKQIKKFIVVANRETPDQGATILAGNKRVVAARLADAEFFWQEDLRVVESDMKGWFEEIETVIFHDELGTQGERVRRITALAMLFAHQIAGADPKQAEDAAKIAKVDLMSKMVNEFPELQGIMGGNYAKHAGYSAPICAAVRDHYSPLGPLDKVPSEPLTISVGLADKLDVLAGFWAINKKPSGGGDPFALRRAALGVIRLVLENRISIALRPLINMAFSFHFGQSTDVPDSEEIETFADSWFDLTSSEQPNSVIDASHLNPTIARGLNPDPLVEEQSQDLMTFLHERLKVYLRGEKVRHDVIDACLTTSKSDDLVKLVSRTRALAELMKTEEGENLIQGFKRANNILTQAEEQDGQRYSAEVNKTLINTEAERALVAALSASEQAINQAIDRADFFTAMRTMGALRQPIDAFFDNVMVNTECLKTRQNRLSLLAWICQTCSRLADLSRIEG
ncbi:MAG: glycine--tRNA ligase subunit beta [Aestuariivita sp.]|nr:glycine--tRNA ligase subunit beta [Aestuariivita sp.]MCY4201759.1 glycine--tRNA ligase subunit beta [Aestuariivita sp.]MCY4289417.1 glycine--tRNA ligase subunit beta [Aestuariivita sp.]MCY4346642.1 glycine--tRNA ligase subunit beta [Aestuariivita sp.]